MKTNLTLLVALTGTVAVGTGHAAAVTLYSRSPGDVPAITLESDWALELPGADWVVRTYLDYGFLDGLAQNSTDLHYSIPSGSMLDFPTDRIPGVKKQDLPRAAWAFTVPHEPVISEDWLIALQYTGFPEAPSPKPLIPVPEPATSTLLVAGVAALTWVRRRV